MENEEKINNVSQNDNTKNQDNLFLKQENEIINNYNNKKNRIKILSILYMKDIFKVKNFMNFLLI